jgi:phage I-like protein
MPDQNYATHDGVKVPREDHAWAPEGSSPSEWKLPLDSSHIESALDMYAHAEGIPADQKHAVAAKIVRYAEKHGVPEKKIEAFKERHLSVAARVRQALNVARVSPPANAGEDTGATVADRVTSPFHFVSTLAAIEDSGVDRIPINVARLSPPANAGEDTGATARSQASNCGQQVFFISLLSLGDRTSTVIPILVTGKWVKGSRSVDFTKDELETAIENFSKLANHDLNVDYDHACEDLGRAAGEPTPSAGRITALGPIVPFTIPSGLRAGEKVSLLQGTYEPTDRARVLIKNREYRYVSAAFVKEYPDLASGESQGLTLTSVALTNQPFLDELPEIWLSIKEGPESEVRSPARTSPESEVRSPKSGTQIQSRLAAETNGGRTMAKMLSLKCSADGKHEVHDGDQQVGEIDHKELCQYAKTHLADDLKLSVVGAADTETLTRKAIERHTREIGAEGKSDAEIRGLIALAVNPPKAEVTLLSECITAEGRLDQVKLNALDDSSAIARSGYRRATDAEQRVDRAYQKGQITPAMLVTGAPLRLALSDGAAFKALIEDRPTLVKVNTVIGVGGSGSETGESPRQLFAKLVEDKKIQLMSADPKLNELEAHRRASALVAKDQPDLLKNYRADSQGPARA